jgi:diguanylate cyclase (GGDEF)-like protein
MNDEAVATPVPVTPMQNVGPAVRPWILTIALAAVGAICFFAFVRDAPTLAESPWPFLMIAALLAAGEVIHVDLARAGEHGLSFAMSDVALAAALLLGRPSDTLIAHVLVTFGVHAFRARRPTLKVVFNAVQVAVADAVAIAAFVAVGAETTVSLAAAIAAIGAVLASTLVSASLVLAVVRASGGRRSPGEFLRTLAISMPAGVANGSVAVEAVFLGHINWLLAPVAIVPFVVLVFAYRGISNQQLTVDKTDFLYRATVALHQEADLDNALIDVLEQAREAVNANAARIVLLAHDGAVSCASFTDSSQPMAAASPEVELAARRLASGIPAATLVLAGTAGAMEWSVDTFSDQDSIAAPLMRDGEPAGVLIVSERRGNMELFRTSDIDLIDLLSQQIGLALEKGFLERSLHQLIELEAQLTYQAYHDGLTGLANRTRFNDELHAAMSDPEALPLAVLLLDVDDFKTVNDSLGHAAGDLLLEEVAHRLVQCVGDTGLTARIGGDEFAVLLTNAELPAAQAAAQAILGNVDSPVVLELREVSVGASLGIAVSTGAPEEPSDVLRNADLALYRAKGAGKGRYAVYEDAMHVEVRKRLELSAALSSAVERDEFILAFQPIHDLINGDVVGAEALVRWRHPQLGELLPANFLALTEESGLIVQIGQIVLDQALAVAASWEPLVAGRPFTISVNVSGRQLHEDGFDIMVMEMLRKHSVPPTRLTLEITESVFIADSHRAQALRVLSNEGVRLSLDDFGTGYSSLSQLHRFPMDQVKIDRSFVSRIAEGASDRTLVHAILQLAAALRMDTVAEGIETRDQLRELRRLGCHRGQGWLLGSPQSADHIAGLLSGGLPDWLVAS